LTNSLDQIAAAHFEQRAIIHRLIAIVRICHEALKLDGAVQIEDVHDVGSKTADGAEAINVAVNGDVRRDAVENNFRLKEMLGAPELLARKGFEHRFRAKPRQVP